MIPHSIFITRNLSQDSQFTKELEPFGYKVFGESLISVTPIRFTHTPKCDWIFFSSRNAIRFFFAQEPSLSPGVRYAVFGKGSASELEKYGKTPSYIGTGNDAASIARKFIELVDGDIILFPQAIDSLQTVQRWLPFNNIARNLFVYKTVIRSTFEIPETEIIVFTSPSNVTAYFNRHKIRPDQVVIAIGTSTRLSLKSRGMQAIMPESFDEESIISRLKELITAGAAVK